MAGHRYRTRRRAELSQHFLRSGAAAARLVAGSSISSRDLVVEVGPGRGALTRELASRCRNVIAVEIDEFLLRALRTDFADSPNVVLFGGDFLHFRLPRTDYKVFANVPYNRTAAIVRRLVEASTPPFDAYLVVQAEAAGRFAGAPYAAESLASLLIKPWWQVEVVEHLRRTDFEPPPSVDSALLWLARRQRPLVVEGESSLYRGFVKASFGRKGNSLKRCLGQIFTSRQIARLADRLTFDPNAPPSALTFDQWLGLFRFLVISGTSGRRRRSP